MDQNKAMKIKKLFESVKKYEQENSKIVHQLLEKYGYEYSSLLPASIAKIEEDAANDEIIKLRINHHENKRLNLMIKLLKDLKTLNSTENKSETISENRKIGSLDLVSDLKEKMILKEKRRSEASERAFKLQFNQKLQLINKIREKELKTKENKTKYLAAVKEKIEKFQRDEKNKFDHSRQSIKNTNTLSFNDNSIEVKHRDTKSVTPYHGKLGKFYDKKEIDEDTEIVLKLQSYEEKMMKAMERHHQFVLEKVKEGEKRSQTIKKIRFDIENKKKEYDRQMVINLVEINDNINKSKSNKFEFLKKKQFKNYKVSTSMLNKSGDESQRSISLIEKDQEKLKKIEEKIEKLKSKNQLVSSLKKEKYKLALSDILEKQNIRLKLENLNKTKIISKHLKTAKALEMKKTVLDRQEQEIREKAYLFSEKYINNKKIIQKEMQDCLITPLLITA